MTDLRPGSAPMASERCAYRAKWIDFVGPVPSESGRTLVWAIVKKGEAQAAARGEAKPLGFIGWYAPWRRYTFQPEPNTVFEPTCLRDVAAFIDLVMADRKQMRASRLPLEPIAGDPCDGDSHG